MPIEREKIRAGLIAKGFEEVEDGDHKFYHLYHNGKSLSIFTKLSHGSGYKEYSDELVARVYKQLRTNKKNFIDLIECRLSHDAYIDILEKDGFIKTKT